MTAAGAGAAAVAGNDGRVVGAVSREALRRVPRDERPAPVSTVTARVALGPDGSLDEGMHALTEAGADLAPVVQDAARSG